jgi:ABC-2 type transport system permease protein
MYKTLWVAWREFISTVASKGFLLGVFLPPVLITGALMLMPILMNQAAPKVVGHVAVIDQTGLVAPKLEQAFTPEAMSEWLGGRRKSGLDKAEQIAPMDPTARALAEQQIQASIPELSLQILPADADIEAAKAPLMDSQGKQNEAGTNFRLVTAIIPPGALVRGPDEDGKPGPYGSFEMFIAPKLDPEVQEEIRDQIGRSIVDARLEQNNYNPAEIRDLVRRPDPDAKVVTTQGERTSSEALAFIVPVGFMMLLWISVFTGGQYLLTSTVEEKSNRVMEVLLSAVSPMQLMVGKIVGQMCVAFLILVAYTSLGVGSLFFFQQNHMLEPMSLVYMFFYFIISFFVIASMMAAIGSAVNDMREAQALLGPVMIVLIIPMMLWMPISRNPNSIFAVVCSFLPPIGPFVMVVRMAGAEKIPYWQIPASIAVGALSVWFAAWAAAKVFRIGILMYGKPPNFRTLMKWIAMA